MKKIILLIVFILTCFFCYSSTQPCDHDWKLDKVENGKRYWVCENCGEKYVASPKTEIKLSEKTEKGALFVGTLVLLSFISFSILSKFKGVDYDKERHCRNTIYLLLPFIIVFGATICHFLGRVVIYWNFVFFNTCLPLSYGWLFDKLYGEHTQSKIL